MIKPVHSDKIYAPVGPYSAATKVDCGSFYIIHTSGYVGIDPKTNKLVSEDVCEQAKMTMENLKNIITDSGANFDNVARVTIYLTNMDDFSKVNAIYASYLNKDHLPSRACFQVSKLPGGAKVEIEAILYVAKSTNESNNNNKNRPKF